MSISLSFFIWLGMGISSLSIVGGAVLIRNLLKNPVQETEAFQISKLMIDGFNAYGKRFISSMIQIILYTSIVLLIFSHIFNEPFDMKNVVTFFLGGSIIMILLILKTLIIPKLMPKILQKSHQYLPDAVIQVNNSVTSLAWISSGSLTLGLLVTYLILGPRPLIGYGLGVVFAAFFLRTGGGLLKSASNISLDTIKKSDKTIPKDKRNPGNYLNILGNFGGRFFGFEADIISSFILAIIALILMVSSLESSGLISTKTMENSLLIASAALSINLVSSWISYTISTLRAKAFKTSNLLLEGLYGAILTTGGMMWFIFDHIKLNLSGIPFLENPQNASLFLAYSTGIIVAILIGFTSEFLTSYRFQPTQKIAEISENGAIITIFKSLSTGYLSNALYLLYIASALMICVHYAGVLGPVMASLGMLSVTCTMTIISTFSPFANGLKTLQELTEENNQATRNTYQINQIGQTSAALGNGLVASASIMATLSVFIALIFYGQSPILNALSLNLNWFIGLIIGIMLPYSFLGTLLYHLQKLIRRTVAEIPRQFKEIPFLKEGKAKPDITKATDDQVRYATDALIIPGILMALPPIAIGYMAGSQMLLSFTLGIVLTGLAQSYAWANSGDAAHSARNYIENGHFGGKESPHFHHIQTTDNLGDAYKDLLSPSLNLFVKAVTILAGLIIILTT